VPDWIIRIGVLWPEKPPFYLPHYPEFGAALQFAQLVGDVMPLGFVYDDTCDYEVRTRMPHRGLRWMSAFINEAEVHAST